MCGKGARLTGSLILLCDITVIAGEGCKSTDFFSDSNNIDLALASAKSAWGDFFDLCRKRKTLKIFSIPKQWEFLFVGFKPLFFSFGGIFRRNGFTWFSILSFAE